MYEKNCLIFKKRNAVMQNLKRALELFKFKKKNEKTANGLPTLRAVFKCFIASFSFVAGKQLAVICFSLIKLYYPYLFTL